jgi:hypothetical protein
MYLGGDPMPTEPIEGDRGDDPAPQSPSPEPQAPEPVVVEPEVPENPVPPRGPDGKFVSPNPEAQSPETKPEGEADDAPKIPKARLDKEIEKRRMLERENAELRATKAAEEQAAVQQYDFDGAEKQYMDLLLDGKLDEAAAKRREIRAAERAEVAALAEQTSQTVNSKAAQQEAMGTIAAQYEQDYPGFDPESDEYDATALTRAQAVFRGYMDAGIFKTPAQAFEEALKTTVAVAGWAKPGPTPTPTPTPTPAPARTAAPRVAAITGQPPVTAGAGQSGASQGAIGVPDPTQLTDEQLAALPPATLKRMRGDEL